MKPTFLLLKRRKHEILLNAVKKGKKKIGFFLFFDCNENDNTFFNLSFLFCSSFLFIFWPVVECPAVTKPAPFRAAQRSKITPQKKKNPRFLFQPKFHLFLSSNPSIANPLFVSYLFSSSNLTSNYHLLFAFAKLII